MSEDYNAEQDTFKKDLFILMHELSEDAYYAAWMEYLDVACKDIVEGKLLHFGMLTDVEIRDYKKLLTIAHDNAGGWWVWDDDAPCVFEDYNVKFVRDGEGLLKGE